MIAGTIEGDDAKISNAFTSANNLVIFHRPLVMPNPYGDGIKRCPSLSCF